MSYILEALKKSEQGRQSKLSKEIADSTRLPPVKKEKYFYLLIITTVLVSINIIGIFLFLENQSQSNTNDATNDISPSSTLVKKAITDTPPALEETKVLIKHAREEKIQGRNQTQKRLTTVNISIEELDPSIQEQIPNLIFTSHLYTDDSQYRMVNINGSMYKEKDFIENGIQLVEITETGIILNYQEFNIAVSILRDWHEKTSL